MKACDRKYNFDMGRYTIAHIRCYKCRRFHYNWDARQPAWVKALLLRADTSWRIVGPHLVRT